MAGIEEGRRGFENLKKILAFSLADNVAEMYCFCFCVILNIPLPLGTMAILLTVLGTDIFPAVSLMYETSETDVMKLKPRNPATEKLITPQYVSLYHRSFEYEICIVFNGIIRKMIVHIYRLLSHVYLKVAVLEAAAGFFSYFATMWSYGFTPMSLIGIRQVWEHKGINDLADAFGQEWVSYCIVSKILR